MSNIKQFVREKKDNFCKYLIESFPKYKDELMEKVDQINKVNEIDFLVYIKENISKNNDLKKYINDNYSSYFDDDEEKNKLIVDKIERYLKMFIDLAK